MPVRIHTVRDVPTHRRMRLTALALMLFLFGTACTPDPTASVALPSPTSTQNALSRIHHASQDNIPLFARILFTSGTTYEQAAAILGTEPYAWNCDDPRTPVPPPLGERRAAFAALHMLLVSYPRWDQFRQIAASPHVISVDGVPLYPCP